MCVRPQTYEDVVEAQILNDLYTARGGRSVNTVFCILAPDGETRLVSAGRSPQQRYETPERFAEALAETFEGFADDAEPVERLPQVDALELALNVAACDSLPLVVLQAPEADALEALEQRTAALAWSAEHIGLQHYVSLDPAAELPDGVELQLGLSILEPDAFGRTFEVLAHAPPEATAAGLAAAMTSGRAAHYPEAKRAEDHLRQARRLGIEWESELPVEDPGRSRPR